MKMDKAEGMAAMEVERFSKLGTLKLKQGQPQKALEAYKNAYHSVQGLAHHGYMQRACAFNLGAMLISVGSYHEGLTYLNQAIPPEGRRDGRSNGDLYFNLGLAYEGLKNLTESRKNFMMALKEYKTEPNSYKMVADTVSRLGKICVSSGQISEAESWMKQLIQACESLGETEKLFHARTERANLLLKMDRAEEAEEVADECLKDAEDIRPSDNIANVLIELGLVYTQLCQYEKALQCSERAIPLVQSSYADAKQATVLYQNLGAIYNYMGQYENAIKYHQSAANKHAELKNRKSQGHCFINMGYAYSQLKDMDKAGECFLHSLQAAKDCGDRKSEWQSLEALGSVFYHQGALKRSQDSYKEALTVLGKSSDAVDTTAQDRIMGKLTYIIQLQIQKPKSQTQAVNVTQVVEKKVTETEVVVPQQAQVLHSMPELRHRPQSKDGSVLAVKRGNKVKYLRVRRSGTLRKFKKVALGLDPSSPTSSPDVRQSGEITFPSEFEEVLSASTTDISDDEIIEDADQQIKHERPHDSYIPHGKGVQRAVTSSEENGDDDIENVTDSGSEEDDDDADEDKKQFIQYLQQQIATGDDKVMTQTVKKEVIADIHAEPKQIKPSTAAESSDEESSSYSSSGSESSEEEDEQDEVDETPKNRQPAPPVPSLSPKRTGTGPLRTYESPANSELHYETIDHKPPAGPSSDSRRQPPSAGTLDGTIYESIRPPSRLGRNTPGADKDSDEAENEEDESQFNKMSKGERDIMEFKAFQADMRKQHETAKEQDGDQKSSKHCIVM